MAELNQIVSDVNILKAAACKLLEIFALRLLAEETSAQEIENLQSIATDGHSFWLAYIRLILNGGNTRSKSPSVLMLKRMFSESWSEIADSVNEALQSPKIKFGRILEQAAKDLDINNANLVVGKLQNLKAHFLNEMEEDADTFLARTGSQVGDDLSVFKFWKVNSLLPEEKRWAFVPQSRHADGFFLLTEEALVNLWKNNLARYASIKERLFRHQGEFIEQLFGPAPKYSRYLTVNEYSVLNDVEKVEFAQRGGRVLQNTILTDGLQLKVHAIDLSRAKSTSVTGTAAASKKKSIGLLQASKCNYIPDRICGIDTGRAFAFGACAMEAQEDGKLVARNNLAVRTRALNDPSRQHRSWLEQRKQKHASILEWERALERRDGEDDTAYFRRWFDEAVKVRRFYNSVKMKKRRWDLNKATRAVYNKAVRALLLMNGTKPGRHRAENMRLSFAIGDSDFGSGTHSAFEKYFVSQVILK